MTTASTTIGNNETAVELEPRLANLGVAAVTQAIDQLSHWDGESIVGDPQDPSEATGARRLRKNDGWIDWSRSATEIFNQIRAFQPWPGSFTEWHNPSRKPLRLIVHAGETVDLPDGTPGHVAVADKQQLVVQTGQGGLRLLSVQPAGKRPMEIEEFLRGYQPRVSDQMARA